MIDSRIEEKIDGVEKDVVSIKDAIIDDRKAFNEFIDGVTVSLKDVL